MYPTASAAEIFVRFCGISGGLNQLGEGELVTLGVKDAVDVAEGVDKEEVVDEADEDGIEDIVIVPVEDAEDVAELEDEDEDVDVAELVIVAEEDDEDVDVAEADDEDVDVAEADDEDVDVAEADDEDVDVAEADDEDVDDVEGVTVDVGPAVAEGYADLDAEAELVLEAVDVGLGVTGTDIIVIR
jgi:ribonuclease E